MVTVFRARAIRTLDPARPLADHVAVDGGRIVAVGGAVDMPAEAVVDDRFAAHVLVPGFVEGHAHLQVGAMWQSCYCGRFARTGPDGTRWEDADSIDAAVERLGRWGAAHPEDDLIVGWGFDPIYFGRSCLRADLDRVSSDRPVVMFHASLHIVSVNTAALVRLGLLDQPPATDSVPLGADGLPTGELRGPEAMYPAIAQLGLMGRVMATNDEAYRVAAALARRAGVTTMADLGSGYGTEQLDALARLTAEADWPMRLVPTLLSDGRPATAMFEKADAAAARSTDMLRLGGLKIVLDGSIQGFTARVRAGEYVNGKPNGLWYKPPEHVREVLAQAVAEGRQVHIHTNGDQASELVLDLLDDVVRTGPVAAVDVTLQHAQLMDEGLLRRAAALGVKVNLFVNHVFYWGEAHAAATVGEERAAQMNACATALRLGLTVAIHSDEPVTPMFPLFTMWCAVNRRTHLGRVLGPDECLTPAQALGAVTLGPARTLGLADEIGSIEVGKRADFTVLDADPLAVDPTTIRDIGVWGTVCAGRVLPAGG